MGMETEYTFDEIAWTVLYGAAVQLFEERVEWMVASESLTSGIDATLLSIVS